MNSNSGTFYYGVPTTHARGTDDVAIGFGDRAYTWMVRPSSRLSNTDGALEQRESKTLLTWCSRFVHSGYPT